MKQLKDLYINVLSSGTEKSTRSGEVIGKSFASLSFDLTKGFPAVTSKKLAWNSVTSELLWFLSGSQSLRKLRYYLTGSEDSDIKTIWDADQIRWVKSIDHPFKDYYIESGIVGQIYGYQWRYHGGIDQISDLIRNIKNDPYSRRLMVQSYNPVAVYNNAGCLPACHDNFKVVIDGGYLDLVFSMRSNDLFLGLPFNIASYALMTHLLASWTGYKPRSLYASITNPHIYKEHVPAILTYIENQEHDLPGLILPQKAKEGLSSALELTALDFANALWEYKHSGVVNAPLLVG